MCVRCRGSYRRRGICPPPAVVPLPRRCKISDPPTGRPSHHQSPSENESEVSRTEVCCRLQQRVGNGRERRTSMTASLAGLAISFTRHSAMGARCSLRMAAALWRSSARFHRGVLAHAFCAVFAASMTLFTSTCVHAGGGREDKAERTHAGVPTR